MYGIIVYFLKDQEVQDAVLDCQIMAIVIKNAKMCSFVGPFTKGSIVTCKHFFNKFTVDSNNWHQKVRNIEEKAWFRIGVMRKLNGPSVLPEKAKFME